MVNIDVPASVGAPPLNTQHPILTLQKQVGCFNHRVVTLVADKLE